MSKKGSEDKQRLWTTAVKTSNCSYHYLNQILEVIIHHLSSELHGWCFSFLQDLAGWGNQFCLRWCAASSPTYMRDTIIFSSAIIVRQYLILHTHTHRWWLILGLYTDIHIYVKVSGRGSERADRWEMVVRKFEADLFTCSHFLFSCLWMRCSVSNCCGILSLYLPRYK